jgi:hypothetical protein
VGLDKPRDTYLVPFPITEPIPAIDAEPVGQFVNLSKTTLFIPGFLIDYYNRRALVSVAAEMRNTEIQITPIDEAGNPLEQQAVVYLGSPDLNTIYRLTSEPNEISQYLRTAQHLVLACYGRRVGADPDADHPAILKHVTLVLLLGELPP